MKTAKKTSICFLVTVVFLFTISIEALAQNDERGSKDHPSIPRFPGSTILTYDFKVLNSYVLPLGKISNDTLENRFKLEGKVTQITYAAPIDRSILEIVRSYETFLKSDGYTTLFTGNKDELGNGWLSKFIDATPRAYRYGGAGLDVRMGGNYNYIAAKKTQTVGDIYIALCVATSWFQNFTVIQLDVIETIPLQTALVKVDSKTEKDESLEISNSKESKTPLTDQSILKSKEVKSLDIRIGFGGFSFSEPKLAGASNNFVLTQTGSNTGELEGFRILTGPYINLRYFFNENFGLSLDINYLNSDEYVYTTEKNYASTAKLFFQKVGLTAQIVGKTTPVRLSSTLGAGHCITELYQKIEINPPYTGTDTYLLGKESMLVMFFNVDVSFPIYRKLYLFGNYELNFIPYGDFEMKHDGGNDYKNTLYSTDFGGSHFRFGLGYSF